MTNVFTLLTQPT